MAVAGRYDMPVVSMCKGRHNGLYLGRRPGLSFVLTNDVEGEKEKG